MATTYVTRYVDRILDQAMPDLPAILLDGPKGVGKTSTASQRVKTVVAVETPAIAARLTEEPSWITGQEKPVLIDEWHRVEPVWDAIKRAVDEDSSGGQFLLTGSLPSGSTHSGAGRITDIRMRPMILPERGVTTPSIFLDQAMDEGKFEARGNSDFLLEDYISEIVQSGFPGIRKLSRSNQQRALEGYLNRLVDVDIPHFGLSLRKPATLRSWLAAYAASTGSTASLNTIRDAASAGDSSPSRITTGNYLNALTRLRIIDELEPWLPQGTSLQRLTVSPKRYLADPALAARLTNFTEQGALTHDLTGALFEHLVALSLRVMADTAGAKLFHLRTRDARAEVDFIIQRPDGKILAIESKLGSRVTEKDTKHLLWLKNLLGDRVLDLAVVNTGAEAWRMSSGVAVIPLALLG